MNIIEQNINSLKKICEKHKVSKMYVFGSLVKNKFTEKSDIDFLVSFDTIELMEYADNYFDFLYALENLFHRKIDLLEEQSLKNPYLKKSIDHSKQLVYG